jgi:hypothetical protein
MSNNLKDILSESNKDIDNQKLMDYLSNHISQADTHEVEKNMANDIFVNDAVEGLQQFTPSKDLQLYVEQLNSDLQKQIVKNKKRKEKRRIKDQPYTYFAIIFILLLLVICFLVIRRNNQPAVPTNKPTTALQIK